jgi:hypothetical protein
MRVLTVERPSSQTVSFAMYIRTGGLDDESGKSGLAHMFEHMLFKGTKTIGTKNYSKESALLDEIDKMSRAFSGDPAAAMLEVLDPEQNSNFLDHYLDVGFDLSKVFFIATANSLEGIPGPLLDRMEVIDLSGYTTAEKLHIAKNHLIPEQLKEHGISKDQLIINDDTLIRMISSYTREAGVRELQRKIANLIRASSERILSSEEKPIRIKAHELDEILGTERYNHEIAETMNPPGVALVARREVGPGARRQVDAERPNVPVGARRVRGDPLVPVAPTIGQPTGHQAIGRGQRSRRDGGEVDPGWHSGGAAIPVAQLAAGDRRDMAVVAVRAPRRRRRPNVVALPRGRPVHYR